MTNLERQLYEALMAAYFHLDYCGFGDSWERECARETGLEQQITDALDATGEDWRAEMVAPLLYEADH